MRQSNQIKSNQKVLFKVGTFYNNQHKLSRAFQTDMHSKLHKFKLKTHIKYSCTFKTYSKNILF